MLLRILKLDDTLGCYVFINVSGFGTREWVFVLFCFNESRTDVFCVDNCPIVYIGICMAAIVWKDGSNHRNRERSYKRSVPIIQ